MNTMCTVSIVNHLSKSNSRRVLELFSATEQLKGEIHKSKVLLTATTLLVVKAENIYQNTMKMPKSMETELSH